MKVYIAGAITDNPNYEEQFKAAEERLKESGHAVINPCKNEGFTYREYINMGLCELMHCDAIYLLKGYENSTGATLEHDYARTVGLKIMLEEDEVQTGGTVKGPHIVTVKCSRVLKDKELKKIVEACKNRPFLLSDKHIPKKPLERRFGVMVCPDCERAVARRVAKELYEEKHDFCSHCGQAINWEV